MKDAIAMNEPEQIQDADRERQELIKQAHSLIAAISSRPGSTKLLRTIVPMLRLYSNYKTGRRRQSGSR